MTEVIVENITKVIHSVLKSLLVYLFLITLHTQMNTFVILKSKKKKTY